MWGPGHPRYLPRRFPFARKRSIQRFSLPGGTEPDIEKSSYAFKASSRESLASTTIPAITV